MQLHEKIQKLKESVHLSAARKAELKGALMLHVARSAEAPQSWFSRYMRLAPAFAAVMILVLAGSGVAAAAESSVPGDFLYPVKVNVTEKVATAFTFNEEAKIEHETALASRRLDEAAQLAAEEKLDATTKADLEVRFQNHAAEIEKKIAKLQSNGKDVAAASLAANFEASLKNRQNILNRLSVRSSSTDESVRPLGGKVKETLDAVAKVRGDLDANLRVATTSIKIATAATLRITKAGKAIEATQQFINQRKEKFGGSATGAAEVQLRIARDFLAKAEVDLKANASGEAFVSAGEAIRLAQESRLAVRTSATTQVQSSSSEGSMLTPQEVRFPLNAELDEKIDSLLDSGL